MMNLIIYMLPSLLWSWNHMWQDAEHVGQITSTYRILVGKPIGKWSLERSQRRWEDIISKDLGDINWESEVDAMAEF